MYKNTDEQMMLSLNHSVRSTHRSDGTVKIYGHTIKGDLMTTVMAPTETSNYRIVEVKVAGKIIHSTL